MSILLSSNYVKSWLSNFQKSKATKSKYLSGVRKFEQYLIYKGFEGELDFNNFHASRVVKNKYLPIQTKFLDEFFQYLVSTLNCSAKTLMVTVISLKDFFGYLYDFKLIENNPLDSYPTPKHISKTPNSALSVGEVNKVLEVALKQDPTSKKIYTLFWFMVETGLRVSELCSLRLKNINFQTKFIFIDEATKSDSNSVSMSQKLCDELLTYTNTAEYLKYSKGGSEYLFNDNGRKFQTERIRLIFSRLSLDANLGRAINPHDLRRTTAYFLQRAGVELKVIQRQLRHKNIATTLKYLPYLSDMEKIINSDESVF